MVGTHIHRNITWAEQALPFMTYLARVSYMLQQGQPVADIAYLLPEGAPSTMPFWGAGLQPAPPAGYDYDYLNTDVLLHRTTVTPDGLLHIGDLTYRLLVLPPTTQITPEVLQKLHDLVAAGATITGPRPLSSPSLAHYPDADTRVQSLATDLWGDSDGVTLTQHAFGKGLTYNGLSLNEILTRLKTPPDFASSSTLDQPPVWVHRRTPEADIYFVANQSDRPVDLEARFRVSGKDVQLWRPMDSSLETQPAYTTLAALEDRTGNRQPTLQPAAYTPQPGFTTVPLHLAERESLFVVFRNPASAPSRTARIPSETTLTTVQGPWTITFPTNAGAPSIATLPKLISWTESPTPGIKYFSGTATYTKTLQAPATWFHPNHHLYLDLGKVRDIAEVTINGQPAGLTWAPPYRLDVTKLLHPGANQIRIAVTNQWTNRLAGDHDLPPDQHLFPPAAQPNTFGRPLVPQESGLLGEVTLISTER